MTPFHLGQALTFEALSESPYPIFRRLQAEEPVTWASQLGMWLATRREDVVAIFDDSETYEVGLRTLFERLLFRRLDPNHPSALRGHELRAPPALHIRCR